MAKQRLQTKIQKAKDTVTLKVNNAPNRSRSINDQLRGKNYVTQSEVESICAVINKQSRYPVRDELMVLMAFTHGLRVGELVNLQWQQLNFKNRQLKVNRQKNGIDTTHPITSKREIMLLKRLHTALGKPHTGYLFNTERDTPVSVNGFQRMFGAYSERALGVKWNAHALRHGCGTALVDQGIHLHTIKDFLGHRNIQNTAVYLHNSEKRFNGISWD